MLWHCNYHPDGGQLFFPLEARPFLVPLALPGDDVRPGQAYLPMHWGSASLGGAGMHGINALTSPARCPQSASVSTFAFAPATSTSTSRRKPLEEGTHGPPPDRP